MPRMNPRIISLGLVSVAVLIGAVMPGGARAEAEASSLLMFDRNGMQPPNALTIMDLRVQFPDGDSYDAILTSRALQGLVNRTNRDKIYFFNDCTDRTHNIGGIEWNVQREWLEAADELRNLPRTVLTRESGLDGGLHGLLKRYRRWLRGFVVWDPSEQGKVRMATAGAAVTIAAQKHGLPVSPALLAEIESWGIHAPILVDLRRQHFRNDYEVLNWLVEKYWATSNRRTHAVFSIGMDGAPPFEKKKSRDDWWSNTTFNEGPIDYAVATNGFAFLIDMADRNDDAALMNLLRKYPDGNTQVVGWIPTHPGVLGFAEAPECLKGTSYSVLGNNGISNMSVFGSFPDASVRLPHPKALPASDRDMFVAFGLTDGDALHCVYRGMFDEFTKGRRANFGKSPITWGIAPQLANLAPPVYSYFARHLPAGSDLYIAWADKTNGASDSGLETMALTWRAYAKLADIPVMWTVHSNAKSQRSDIVGWTGIVVGYANSRLDAAPDPVNQNTAILGLWAVPDVKEAAEIVREYATKREEKPGFMVLNIGAPFGSAGNSFYDKAAMIVAELSARPEGRNYHFVSARDLAATFTAWTNASKERNGR